MCKLHDKQALRLSQLGSRAQGSLLAHGQTASGVWALLCLLAGGRAAQVSGSTDFRYSVREMIWALCVLQETAFPRVSSYM